MKNRIGIGLLILLVVALFAIPEASAFGSIKSTLLTKYSLPTSSPLNTCDTCHIPGDTSSWNSYGTDLRAQITGGATATQGMTNIEPLDSDGDGFTNLQELTAVPPTFPGDALSFPPAASDTIPPVITMLGSTPIDIVVGSVYVDAGAIASDNKDGNLTSAIVTVNSVNSAVVGNYTVTYNVVDAAGNHAVEKVRTVNVVGADTTPPVIKMLGSTPIDIVVGSVYFDAGATALDNVDGNLTSAIVTINSVNTSVIGNYTVTYNVVDTAGNHAVEKVRTVNVVASTPAKYYIVTFIVTDNVTGMPIKEAKVSIDRVKKETNRSGIVVFKKVSPGNHAYIVKAEHYKKSNGSIEVGANMTVSVKLVSNKERHDKKHEEKEDKEDNHKESDKEDD